MSSILFLFHFKRLVSELPVNFTCVLSDVNTKTYIGSVFQFYLVISTFTDTIKQIYKVNNVLLKTSSWNRLIKYKPLPRV